MYKLLQHEHIDKKTYNVIIYLNMQYVRTIFAGNDNIII